MPKELNDGWADEYHNKKHPEELSAFATLIDNGIKWRVGPNLQTYCAGPVQNPPEAIPVGIGKPPPKLSEGITTYPPPKSSFVAAPGRPKKDLPEEYVLELTKNGKYPWEIAQMLKIKKDITVSERTIQRIIAGNKVLV